MKETLSIKNLFVKEDGTLWHYKNNQLVKRKTSIDIYGYERCWWNVNKKTKFYKVHRLVAETFILNPENKPYINHINGVKNDNRIQNLEWCTQKENIKHANVLGNIPKGENRWNAKLNWENINEIRRLRKETLLTQKEIAQKFDIKREHVRDIILNRIWVI